MFDLTTIAEESFENTVNRLEFATDPSKLYLTIHDVPRDETYVDKTGDRYSNLPMGEASRLGINF